MPKTSAPKPFICDICGSAFSKQTTLYPHYKEKHGASYSKKINVVVQPENPVSTDPLVEDFKLGKITLEELTEILKHQQSLVPERPVVSLQIAPGTSDCCNMLQHLRNKSYREIEKDCIDKQYLKVFTSVYKDQIAYNKADNSMMYLPKYTNSTSPPPDGKIRPVIKPKGLQLSSTPATDDLIMELYNKIVNTLAISEYKAPKFMTKTSDDSDEPDIDTETDILNANFNYENNERFINLMYSTMDVNRDSDRPPNTRKREIATLVRASFKADPIWHYQLRI